MDHSHLSSQEHDCSGPDGCPAQPHGVGDKLRVHGVSGEALGQMVSGYVLVVGDLQLAAKPPDIVETHVEPSLLWSLHSQSRLTPS
jgi:hypothetical protein